MKKTIRTKPIKTKLNQFNRLLQILIVVMPIILIPICFFSFYNLRAGEIIEKFSSVNPIFILKKDIHLLLENITSTDIAKKEFVINSDDSPLIVKTTQNIDLHKSLLTKIDKSNSRQVAIVMMNPDSGQIITMSGFNKDNPEKNPCVIANFPAASIFKIITAAAAIEKCGYVSNSIFRFNGGKYTLYKQQMIESTNQHTKNISLRNSFAQSVNPVFGKIGSELGGNNLNQYGNFFGFNREISFEIPWDISHLSIEEDSYHWAEIASGFNRQTTLSPLHGAVIVSAIVNDGIPVEPTIIDQIIDNDRTVLYTNQTRFLDRAVTVNTAMILTQLMNATIDSGTGKKTFEGYKDDTILSKLDIGGKTGSIYNKSHDTRFDWFVGFAKNKYGPEKIVVSVVVAHDKYIGTRAGQYAKIAIKTYFRRCFEEKNKPSQI